MGYFSDVLNLCSADRNFPDRLFLGFMILMSPVLIPIYYVGYLGEVVAR